MLSTRCPNFDILCVLLGEAGLRLFRNAGSHSDPVFWDDLGEHEQEKWRPRRWAILATFVFPGNAEREWKTSPAGDPTFNGREPDSDMDDPAWKRQRTGCEPHAVRQVDELGWR